MTDLARLYEIAREELAGPLRAAGLGEPHEPVETTFRLMWHVDGAHADRPVPDSPVWTHFGCYDVVAEHDTSDGAAMFGWGDVQPVVRDHLVVRTEGSTVLDVPWTDDPDEFRAHLHGAGARIGDVVVADIRRFETENDGHLPGAEPR